MLVEQWTSADGDEWVKIRVPKRPNGKTGWVPRDALGPFNVVRTQLVVNRKTLRATLFMRGRKIWSARVGNRRGVDADARGPLLDPREVPLQGHAGLRHARARHGRLRAEAHATGPTAASSASTAPISPV